MTQCTAPLKMSQGVETDEDWQALGESNPSSQIENLMS